MAWWFHPDRKDDLRERLGLSHVADVDVVASTDDSGARVRVATFRDRRGWDHRHRTQWQLDPDHQTLASNGRLTVPSVEQVTFDPPKGPRMNLQCDGRMDFTALQGGSTEIAVIHNHTLTGGRWIWRRNLRRTEQRDVKGTFRKQIEQCEAALRTVSD